MGELVRFETGQGDWLLVETNDHETGVDRIGFRDADGVVSAAMRLAEAVAQVRPAIRTVLDTLRELGPDQHEIKFGIKLSAEAGVVIAKTGVEGRTQNGYCLFNDIPREQQLGQREGCRGVAGGEQGPVKPGRQGVLHAAVGLVGEASQVFVVMGVVFQGAPGGVG